MPTPRTLHQLLSRASAADSFATTLARGALLAFGLRILGLGLGYGLQILLARWMGADAYGAYTYVFAWASTVAIVTDLGLSAAVLRFIPAYRVEQDWARLRGLLRAGPRLVFGLSTALSLAGTGVLLALDAQRGLAQLPLLLLGAWSLPLLALTRLQSEVLRSLQHVGLAYAPLLVLRPFLIAGGAYVLLQGDRTLTSTEAAALAVAALLVIAALQGFALRRTVPLQSTAVRPRLEMRRWLRVSLPLLLTTAFIFLVNQADLLILGLYRDAQAVGVYNAAARTATVVSLALTAVNTVTAPAIASVHGSEGTPGLQRLVNVSVRWIFWPSLLITLLLLGFAKPVLGLFGPAFETAHWALRLLALGHLIDASTGPVGYLLDLTGHQDHSARVYGWCALLNVVLNGIGIPVLGLLGAALATSLTIMLRNIWLYVLVVRFLNVHASVWATIGRKAESAR